eukprot:9259485-Karenia_brevis.AAC.1
MCSVYVTSCATLLFQAILHPGHAPELPGLSLHISTGDFLLGHAPELPGCNALSGTCTRPMYAHTLMSL